MTHGVDPIKVNKLQDSKESDNNFYFPQVCKKQVEKDDPLKALTEGIPTKISYVQKHNKSMNKLALENNGYLMLE